MECGKIEGVRGKGQLGSEAPNLGSHLAPPTLCNLRQVIPSP